jgi:7-cyano-7-deazaguanine reductase
MDKTDQLRHLGSQKTDYKYDEPSAAILDTFPNKYPENDYQIEFIFPEFTSLCPKTGQPDFCTIEIRYSPNSACIETKSLKLYFFAFRNYGSFMESITNKILNDLVSVCQPKWMEVVGKFNPRGGITLNVTAEYDEQD